MKTIMLVDDDPVMGERLRRLLKPLEGDWKMVSVDSGQAALDTLAAERCDVIMTDMRMPGKTGVQLLEEVRTGYPHMVRVLLMDQSDQEGMLRSVGLAHQCLAKSSPLEVFESTVTRACAIQGLLTNGTLLKLVGGMQTLPSLPTLYREVMQELQSPDASIDKIGQIISKDLGMLTKLLQVQRPLEPFDEPADADGHVRPARLARARHAARAGLRAGAWILCIAATAASNLFPRAYQPGPTRTRMPAPKPV